MNANEPQSNGVPRQAVILFADIVGCSSVSDALPLSGYADFIRQFQDAARRARATALADYREPTDCEFSLRGDEVCIILHRGTTDDIRRALTFAVCLQILWVASPHNRERLAKGATPVELGIGVHVGSVFVARFQHPFDSSEGYAINIAKRIEGITRRCQYSRILISPQVHHLMPAEDRGLAFRSVEFSPQKIRGVSGEFLLREIVGANDSLLMELDMPRTLFDETFLAHLDFVSQTRVDVPWIRELHRITYGIAKGRDEQFRWLLARLRTNMQNSASWLRRGFAERVEGDHNMGAMFFEMAASKSYDEQEHGQRSWAQYNAGLEHERRGSFENALSAFQDAILARPGYIQYELGLALCYLRARRPKEAARFIHEIRDELVGDRDKAAALYVESACEEGASTPNMQYRQLLWSRYSVDISVLPTFSEMLTVGVDGADLLLRRIPHSLAPAAPLSSPQSAALSETHDAGSGRVAKKPRRQVAKKPRRRPGGR